MCPPPSSLEPLQLRVSEALKPALGRRGGGGVMARASIGSLYIGGRPIRKLALKDTFQW